MQPNFSFAAAKTPFCPGDGSNDIFAYAGWQQAQAATLDALGRSEAVVLLGPPGAGKSLLLQSLVPLLQHEGRVARLVEHGDLLRQGAGADVLLVDDAGTLNAGARMALCATGVPFVLAVAGQAPALPRPVVRVELPPLTTEEVARFVASRLAAAGRRRDLFEPDAILALARRSAGVLRQVNLIAGGAVSLAEVEGVPRVLRRHVDEAATGGLGDAEAPAALPAPAEPALPSVPASALGAAAPGRRRMLLLAAAGLGVVLTGGLAYSQLGGTAPATQPPSPAPPTAPTAGAPAQALMAAAPAETEQELRDRRVLQALEAEPPGTSPAPRRNDAAPRQQAPAPGTAMSFRGVVDNETIQQSGQMSLVVSPRDPSGSVTARFRAWDGLLGVGELRGQLSDDGVLSVSGQLMVGQNPFTCDLSARITGSTLTGSANFTRNGRISRAVFRLARS